MIDFSFGLCFLYMAFISTFPLGTTWVFLGSIGGREIALRIKEQEFGYFFRNRECGSLGKIFWQRSLEDFRRGLGEPCDRFEHPTAGATHRQLSHQVHRSIWRSLGAAF